MALADIIPKKRGRTMLILCCGGRDWANAAQIRAVLSEYQNRGEAVTILHGGCRGADSLAGEEAHDLGFGVLICEAAWHEHGKAAGPMRNRRMLDQKPDLVIAFGGGKGTADLVGEAKRRDIPVRAVSDTTPLEV
jgi:hypothetical protein